MKNQNIVPQHLVPPKKPLTPRQVKSLFKRRGKTFTEWAIEHGYTRSDVYRVLNGQHKALYGKGHEIAVKLGIKVSEEPEETTTD